MRFGGNIRRNRGFTLIECLVYIAMLLLISGVTFLTFYRTRDNARDLSRNADDVSRAVHAGEQWRADIRLASGRVQLADVDGEARLRIPQAQGEVVYYFREGQMYRQAADQTSVFLTKVKESRMQTDARENVTAWRWELELQGRPDRTRIRPLFSFQAVAPGEQKK